MLDYTFLGAYCIKKGIYEREIFNYILFRLHIITKIKVTNPRLVHIICESNYLFNQVIVGDHDITKSDGEQRITPK